MQKYEYKIKIFACIMISGTQAVYEGKSFECCCGKDECLPERFCEEACQIICTVTGSMVKQSCLAKNNKGKDFFPGICVTCEDSIKGGAKFKEYNESIFYKPATTTRLPPFVEEDWVLVSGLACKLTVKLVENQLIDENHKNPLIDDIMKLPEFHKGNEINISSNKNT